MKPPDDGRQLRLDWGKFIPDPARRPMWKVESQPGKRCPACGCTPESPCRFELEEGSGVVQCVPAGVLGLKTCSRCAPKDKP